MNPKLEALEALEARNIELSIKLNKRGVHDTEKKSSFSRPMRRNPVPARLPGLFMRLTCASYAPRRGAFPYKEPHPQTCLFISRMPGTALRISRALQTGSP